MTDAALQLTNRLSGLNPARKIAGNGRNQRTGGQMTKGMSTVQGGFHGLLWVRQ